MESGEMKECPYGIKIIAYPLGLSRDGTACMFSGARCKPKDSCNDLIANEQIKELINFEECCD